MKPEVDDSIIERINKCARQSPNYKQTRHCAVIFSPSGELVCYANNRYQKHAEMRVLSKYFSYPGFYGKGIGYMLVVRVNKTGTWINSKPCIKCQKMLIRYNIKVVHS